MCKMRFREVNLDSCPDARTGRSPGCFIQRIRQRVPADGKANVGLHVKMLINLTPDNPKSAGLQPVDVR
jgi:hypothetical protein